MANTQIDVSVDDFDINDVTTTAAGTVTNDLRVVIGTGVDRHAAYVALTAICYKLGADDFTLN